MPVILFVCTANRFRSPIAAAYTLQKVHAVGQPGEWTIISAGTWTDNDLPAHPEAVSAAATLGIDLSGHRSHVVTSALINASDLVVVMEPGHKEALASEFPTSLDRIALLGDLAGEHDPVVPDPALDGFINSIEIATLVVAFIDSGYSEMIHRAEKSSTRRQNPGLKSVLRPPA